MYRAILPGRTTAVWALTGHVASVPGSARKTNEGQKGPRWADLVGLLDDGILAELCCAYPLQPATQTSLARDSGRRFMTTSGRLASRRPLLGS